MVQYPVAEPVPPETVGLRLDALAHPVRLWLLRTLARGPTPPANWRTPGRCCRRRSPVIWPSCGRAGLLTVDRDTAEAYEDERRK